MKSGRVSTQPPNRNAYHPFMGTYVPPVPPPLPRNIHESVYSVKNPSSMHTTRSASSQQSGNHVCTS
ncbi:unnamed protein product [Auanema sp. JU1783]|nr:unnamed protein product [Auanema sp. JU1783]